MSLLASLLAGTLIAQDAQAPVLIPVNPASARVTASSKLNSGQQ